MYGFIDTESFASNSQPAAYLWFSSPNLDELYWFSLNLRQITTCTKFCFWFGIKVPVVFQLLSRVWLFVTPWTAAGQSSLSFTIFLSLLKLMSVESVMPSNCLILCHPLLLLNKQNLKKQVCSLSKNSSSYIFEMSVLSCIFTLAVVYSLSHVWLCHPMDCSMSGFPVLHCLP